MECVVLCSPRLAPGDALSQDFRRPALPRGLDQIPVSLGSNASVQTCVLFAFNSMHPLSGGRFFCADAATTRRRLFDRAAADNAIVLAYHFPFPGIGRVKKSANAWKWESLKA